MSDKLDIIKTLIDASMDELIVLVSDLMSGSADKKTEAKVLLAEHVESFLMMAEASDLLFLSDIFHKIQSALSTNEAIVSDARLADILLKILDDIVNSDYKSEQQLNKLVHSDEQLIDFISATDDIGDMNDFDDIDDLFSQTIEDEQFDDTDILSMVAQELQQMQTELAFHAHIIATTDGEQSQSAITAYQQILLRIEQTAQDVDLPGLVFICKFINDNLIEKNANLTRMESVLSNWVETMAAHLFDPANDALCLAITDFLELEQWPKPLEYKNLRQLIEGLTKAAEITGVIEQEQRKNYVSDDDVQLLYYTDTSTQLIDAFISEAPAQADQLSQLIQSLPEQINIAEQITIAQRITHTLKGSAHLVGLMAVANYAHHLEDIFEFLGQSEQYPSTPLMHTLQEAGDNIEAMMDFLLGTAAQPQNLELVLQQLIDWALLIDQGDLSSLCAESAKHSEAVADTFLSAIPQHVHNAEKESDTTNEKSSTTSSITTNEMVRVSKETLDKIFNLVGETSIALAQMQEQLKLLRLDSLEMHHQEQTLQERRFELENSVNVKNLSQQQKQVSQVNHNDGFDSLEMDHYDTQYGAAHSFIEVVNDSRLIMHEVFSEVLDLEDLSVSQQRLNNELQELVLSTRLETVQTLSSRLHRCVRQTCRMTQKKAQLIIIGEDLMMDGDMLKKIADPLMHLLRNAIDHGIEAVDIRHAKNKSESGKIVLHFQQQGNQIKISCKDDGQGLDYEAIKNKAMAKGWLEEGSNIDQKELARIILQAGFTTREQASHVSGRGVGLDVVYNAITNMNGSFLVENNSDNDAAKSGVNIILNLPMTLLTNHALLVSVGAEKYAIPSNMLEQILSPNMGSVEMIAGNPGFKLNKDIYPLKSLAQLLGDNSQIELADYARQTMLLVKSEMGTIAVAIEVALASEQLVIKSLGHYVNHVKSVSGVSLLGNGQLVPVLNMNYLFDNESRADLSGKALMDKNTTPQLIIPKILIVDDSLSVRSSLAQLVTDSGYQPVMAKDGVEALEIIEEQAPALVLTDLEMPRMTGLELTARIRRGQHHTLPVIMVTTRTANKHRQQAKKSGVSDYVSKPFSEDELMQLVEAHIHP